MAELDTPVKWLHISDFHFKGGDEYDRDVVTRSLLTSMPHLLERFGPIDFIIATGDIAHSGKEAEYQVATKFFDELLAKTNLSRKVMFTVPGNHDVNRQGAQGLKRSLDSTREADDYFSPDKSFLHITTRQAAFGEWFNAFYKGIRCFPTSTTVFQT